MFFFTLIMKGAIKGQKKTPPIEDFKNHCDLSLSLGNPYSRIYKI